MAALLVGTVLSGAPAIAQDAPESSAPPAAPAPIPGSGIVSALAVVGSQRLEPDTVRSYIDLRAGKPYTRESIDKALKDLYATEPFADVQIRDDNGHLTIQVKEHPVVNRIVLDGNKRVKEDKVMPEIRLAAREIFSRTKVRPEIARLLEL